MLVPQSSRRDNRQKVMDEDVVLWLLVSAGNGGHWTSTPEMLSTIHQDDLSRRAQLKHKAHFLQDKIS